MIRRLTTRDRAGSIAVVLGGVLVGAVLAAGTTAIAPPVYTASAETRVIVEGEPGHEDAGTRSAFRQAELLADLVVSPAQLELIGRELEPPASGTELAGAVTARRQPDLLIITISARDRDPARAAALANTTAQNLVSATDARTEAARIRLEVVESAAVPQHPSHRHLPRNLTLGAIAGLTVAAAALATMRRRRPTQVEPAHTRRSVDRLALVGGATLGLAIIGGIAFRVPDMLVQAAAVLAVAVAAISPGAGLATIAVTMPMPEPPGFAWLSYPAVLAGATAYGLLLAAAVTRVRPRVTALGVLAVGYLAISAVSAIPALTGFGEERTINAAARLIQVGGGILLVAVAWTYFSRRDPRPHLVLAIGAAAVAGLLAILQYSAGSGAGVPLGGLIVDPPTGGEITRATGPFSNPNYFGQFLGRALIVAIALAVTGVGARFLVFLSLPIAVALVLTFSRGAFLATGAGMVALVWMRSRVAGSLVTLLAVISFLTVIPFVLELRSGSPIIPRPPDFGDEISDSGRFDAMLSSLPIWRLDPLFGAGFGQYGVESAWYVGSSPSTSSHNEYLSLLAEQGIIGIVLFGSLAALAIRASVGNAGWSRDVALPALVTLAAGAMFSEPLATLQTSGLLWLVVGATAGRASVPHRHARGAARLLPSIRGSAPPRPVGAWSR